jgi:hypothetical protein
VPKRPRINYLIWEEGHAPQVVIEITSSSTQSEDQERQARLLLEQQLAEARAELEELRHRPPANGHP